MVGIDVSDVGIAVMCDIARASGLDLDADKQIVLDGLIADGLVEAAAHADTGVGGKFVLTSEGQKLLDRRGVGVNES